MAIWWIYWREANACIQDGVASDEEWVSRFRAMYVGLIVLIGVALPAAAIAGSIAAIGRMLMGESLDGGLSLAELVVGPPLAAAPFAIAAWLQVRSQLVEAEAMGAGAVASARSVTNHLSAVVGLAFLAVGAGELVWLVLDRLVAGQVIAGSETYLRDQAPWFVAQIFVGAALWIPAWTAIRRSRSAQPDLERRAGA